MQIWIILSKTKKKTEAREFDVSLSLFLGENIFYQGQQKFLWFKMSACH